jgi:hypothetical protein
MIGHQDGQLAEPDFLFIPLPDGLEDGVSDFRMTKGVPRSIARADGHEVGSLGPNPVGRFVIETFSELGE